MRFALALAVSLAVHALLALAVVCWFSFRARPQAVATLDLSSVELSLAEEDVASAAPAAAVPTASAEPRVLRPPSEELPPPPAEIPAAVAVPPPPPAVELPRPPEAAPTMPAEAPRQARVDAPPALRRPIRPDYPRGSRLRGEEGEVVLEIRVSAAGEVEAAEVVVSSGFAALDEEAVRATRAARFKPAQAEGRAVASTARLTLTFKLK